MTCLAISDINPPNRLLLLKDLSIWFKESSEYIRGKTLNAIHLMLGEELVKIFFQTFPCLADTAFLQVSQQSLGHEAGQFLHPVDLGFSLPWAVHSMKSA